MNVGEFFFTVEYHDEDQVSWNTRATTSLKNTLQTARNRLLTFTDRYIEIYHFVEGENLLVVRLRGTSAAPVSDSIQTMEPFKYEGVDY